MACYHICCDRYIAVWYTLSFIFLSWNTGLFEMIVGVLTTCHTQYTWDRSIYIFLFNRTTLQVFVTHLIGALYVHHLWFYKHQHDNRVRSKLFVACQRLWFQWRFWFVPSFPGYLREEEEHKPDPWRNPIRILLSQMYCVWQVVKTPTIILNNPVCSLHKVHKMNMCCTFTRKVVHFRSSSSISPVLCREYAIKQSFLNPH